MTAPDLPTELPLEGTGYLVFGSPEPCPACGIPGSPISRRVMCDHLQLEGIAMVHSWGKAFACLSPSCDCLYYSLWQMVPVRYCNKPLGYKKNSPPPHVLCYCLGLTAQEIRRDLGSKDPGSSVERIREHAARSSFLCEKLNPSGQCCWSQVRKCLDEESGSPSRV